MKSISARTIQVTAISVVLVGVILTAFFGFWMQRVESNVEDNLSGFAWSDTIGWISFNCTDLVTCESTPYGVTISPDGVISGFAWSENIGWISFNESDAGGCPSGGSCSGRLDRGTGAVVGWARALTPLSGNSGGWDGWISLSGAFHQVKVDGCRWGGFAWGSDVVGWIDFSRVIGSKGSSCAIGICTQIQPTDSTICSADDPEDDIPFTAVPSCHLPDLTKCHYECNDGYFAMGAECKLTQCNDMMDNDNDGFEDIEDVGGCVDMNDNDETNPITDPVITASPRIVENIGDSVILTWSTGGMNESLCTISTNSLPPVAFSMDIEPLSGTMTLSVNVRTTYTITCGVLTDTVEVEILPHQFES